MRIHKLIASIAVLGAGLTAAAVPGVAAAAPDCGAVVVTEAIPAGTPVLSWSENVGYDAAGDLWVSRGQQNRIERYDARGRRTGSVRVDAPGAVRLGPDGKMYAVTGDSPIGLVPGLPRRGTVVAFDPAQPRPAVRTVTRGLAMPNGLAFGDDGAMYVADSGAGLTRIRPDGTVDRAWTARAPKSLAPTATVNGLAVNGIAVRDGAAYVSLTESLSGRILRVPLDAPEKTTVAADLTAPLPGVVDDLAWLDDHRLAVATTTGQIVVLDRRARSRCVVNAGRPVTSLAVAPDGRSAVAGTVDGAVLALRGGPFTR